MDEITANPVLSNDTISQSLEISKNLGIEVDPIANFTPNETLNNKISPAAKVTRSIASESDKNASLIKPDVEKLNALEKWGRNSSIQLKIDDLNRKITEKGMLLVASDNGDALAPDDQLELDNAQLDLDQLLEERKNLKLTGVEEVFTGDVVSVFNDTYQAAKESPWLVGSATAAGALAGPAGAWLAFNISTAGGNAAYQLNAATVRTYQELADATDDLGEPLDHQTKKGIAFASGIIQSGLELTGDLALTIATGAAGKGLSKIGEKTGSKVLSKFGAKFTAKEFNDKLVEVAVKDLGFRQYIKSLGVKMVKGAPMEAITEVLQDNTGNFAKALGETWTQDGADVGKAVDKFKKDFDLAQNAETALRAGLTGAVAAGVTDVVVNRSVPKAWDGAKNIYNKKTGKTIQLGEGDTVTSTDSTPNNETSVAVMGDNNKYKIVDGRPVGLDANQLTVLGNILPSINAIRDTNVNLDPDVVTQMQSEQANAVGLDEVYMDKEVIEEWADTPEKRAYVAEMLGGEKGVYVDGQRIRLTRSEYFGMQKFGNTKYINDNTAVTSDGATISDIKKSVEEKKARDIPAADEIQASESINPIVGEDVVDTQGIEAPPTVDLGVQSSIEEVTAALKTKEEADAYLGRLSEAENNSKPIYHGTRAEFDGMPDHRSGGMVFYAEDQNTASRYAQGAGGGRTSNDSQMTIVPSDGEGSLRLNPDTKKWEGSLYGEQVSLDSEKINQRLEEDLEIKHDNSRIVEGSYDPSKNLDITTTEGEKVFVDLISQLANNEVARRIVEQSKQQYSGTNAEFWSLSKYASRNEQFNKDFSEISNTLKDAGFESIKFKDDNHISIALFDNANQERLAHIKEMKDRVKAIRNDLPEVDLNKIASEAVDGYGEFGIVPENIYATMTPKEQEDFVTLVQETKESLKNDLKTSVVKELDKTASMIEREANYESESKIIEQIAENPDTKIVDWFLADETMKIDPDSLTSNQKELYIGNELINKRNIYRKGGAKLSDVADGFNVTPDKLLEVLSTSPSSAQAFKAQMIIEKARNRKEAQESATFNQKKLDKTLDDKISFKRKLLEGILKTDPKAGLRLAYSIMSKGSKTNIEKSSINAQEVTDNTRIGDLKPSTYLNASRRHQNRANEALMKSRDMEKAAVEVEKSMIADELFKASRKTKARVEFVLDNIIKDFKDKNLRDKLKSTGHYEHYKALLGMLGVGEFTPKQAESISDLLIEWQEKGLEAESGLPVQMEAPIQSAMQNNNQVNVNDLSLEQVDTINAYINQIITDSDNIRKNRILNQTYFDQDIRTKAEADAKSNPNYDGRKAETHAPGGDGYISNTVDFISGAVNHVQGMNNIVDWYEFGDKTIPRMILHMIRGVGDFTKQGGTFVRDKLWDQAFNLLTETAGLDTIKRIKSYAGQRIEVSEFANTKAVGADGLIPKTDLISILLIRGSADGKQRLGKLGLNPETVAQTIEQYLHPDDIKVVKAVYKVMKFLQPGIAFVEKTLKGYDNVEYVDGESFEWNGETIEGGYVHFSYLDNDGGTQAVDDFDKKLSQMVGDDKAFVTNESARGYTKEGFKKARTANVDKFINLDFDNLMNKTIGNVVVNNTMLVPIVRSMQILNDKQVSESLRTVMGKHGLQVFKNQVISAANGLVMDLTPHKTAILSSLGKWTSSVGVNVMTAYILGNMSSVFSNTISWNNVVFGNIDSKPTRAIKFSISLLSSLFIPGVHKRLKADLQNIIPELTTTKENYQHNDLNNLSFFKNSKNSNVLIRKFSDFTRGMSEFYFERVMGLFDTVGKTAYASVLLNEQMSKIPNDKKSKMSKEDIKNYLSGAVSDELNRYFPSRDSTNIAIMQKHPIGKQLFLFFNDARVQLNNIYFTRFRDIIRSVTFLPRRVKEKGLVYALGKGVWDVGSNAAILHLQSAIIIAMLRSFRGEDEEGDRNTDKAWHERMLAILQKNLLDPWTTAKAVGEMLPVINAAMRFAESDGKYGYVSLPLLQWAKDAFDAGKGLYESDFVLDNLTDSDKKAIAGFLSGVIPNLPMAPVKSYLLDDSTAFQTGMQSILAAPQIIKKGVSQLLTTVFNDTAEAMVDNMKEATDPDVEEELSQYLQGVSEEQYSTLLTFPRGRAVLKRLLDVGQVAAISPEDVNDIVFAESKGDPNAYNRKTHAAGIYQFLESTWNKYLQTDKDGNLKYPMTEGLSRAYGKDEVPEGEIDGRYDVRQASRMMYIMHNEIAKDFISAGIKPNRDNIYMGHHFGEGPAVKIWQADDDTSLKSAYVSAFKDKTKGLKNFNKAVAANPWMRSSMTVGQTKKALTRLLDKYGRDARIKWEENIGQEFSLDEL